jgi:hypothetical protein
MSHNERIVWNKTASNIWQTKEAKRLGLYVGTITYTNGPGTEFALVITPGPVNSSHKTLRLAKNTFRKFLRDKPPAV